MTTRTELFRLKGAVERDPAIDDWMKEHGGELGAIAQKWFEVMRKCGDEVRELLHDCMSGRCGLRLRQHIHISRKRRILSRRIAAGPGSLVARHRQVDAPCEPETRNGHKRRSAKQAHRRGVHGYQTARRTRLAQRSTLGGIADVYRQIGDSGRIKG
jgi:hypothetical protein